MVGDFIAAPRAKRRFHAPESGTSASHPFHWPSSPGRAYCAIRVTHFPLAVEKGNWVARMKRAMTGFEMVWNDGHPFVKINP
jgi:hypothetical protein